MNSVRIEGVSNYGKPRQDFADDLASKTDAEFVREAETCIWLSAYANNNRRSDYHWQADLCAKEADRRGNPDLYKQAWEQASPC